MTKPHGGQTQRQAVPAFVINDRLRKAREHAHLEIGELADRLGISRNTVSNYESGATHRHSKPTLYRWALVTGVPLEWLLTGEAPAVPRQPDDGQLPHLDSNQKPFGLRSIPRRSRIAWGIAA